MNVAMNVRRIGAVAVVLLLLVILANTCEASQLPQPTPVQKELTTHALGWQEAEQTLEDDGFTEAQARMVAATYRRMERALDDKYRRALERVERDAAEALARPQTLTIALFMSLLVMIAGLAVIVRFLHLLQEKKDDVMMEQIRMHTKELFDLNHSMGEATATADFAGPLITDKN